MALDQLLALIERHHQHLKLEDRRLRSVLYAITGEKTLMDEPDPEIEKLPPEERQAMEVFNRFAALAEWHPSPNS